MESSSFRRKGQPQFSFARNVNQESTCREVVHPEESKATSVCNPLSQFEDPRRSKKEQSPVKDNHFKQLEESIFSFNRSDSLRSGQMGRNMARLREEHESLRKFIDCFVSCLEEEFKSIIDKMGQEMLKVVSQKEQFKEKYQNISINFQNIKKENDLLKADLQEWEQAKLRRKNRDSKLKEQSQKSENSILSPKKTQQQFSPRTGKTQQSFERLFQQKSSVDLQSFPNSVLKQRSRNIPEVYSSSKKPPPHKRSVKSSCSSFVQGKPQKLSVISMFNMM